MADLQKLLIILACIMTTTCRANASNKNEEADLEAGKGIYIKRCEVCHLIGRNLINPEKEIQNSKLLDDSRKLKEFLSHKNGVMPAFPKIASNDTAIRQLKVFLRYAKEHPSEIEKHEPASESKVRLEQKSKPEFKSKKN